MTRRYGRQYRMGLLLTFVLAALPAGGVVRADTAPPNACLNSAAGTNSVVRFYLAISRRQFASAYQCFNPTMAQKTDFLGWKHTFAHQVAAHLVMADDEVPNGVPADHVRIDLHWFARLKSKLTLVSYQGIWHVDSSHLLYDPRITVAYQVPVTSISPTRPPRIFASRGLRIQRSMVREVTGVGISDAIYFTVPQSCTSGCHRQQLWIYRQGKLVFQQAVDDGRIVGWKNHRAMQTGTDTPGTGTPHPTSRTLSVWFWTPWGFVLHSRKIVHIGY